MTSISIKSNFEVGVPTEFVERLLARAGMFQDNLPKMYNIREYSDRQSSPGSSVPGSSVPGSSVPGSSVPGSSKSSTRQGPTPFMDFLEKPMVKKAIGMTLRDIGVTPQSVDSYNNLFGDLSRVVLGEGTTQTVNDILNDLVEETTKAEENSTENATTSTQTNATDAQTTENTEADA